jgi:hypothetical protein
LAERLINFDEFLAAGVLDATRLHLPRCDFTGQRQAA